MKCEKFVRDQAPTASRHTQILGHCSGSQKPQWEM